MRNTSETIKKAHWAHEDAEGCRYELIKDHIVKHEKKRKLDVEITIEIKNDEVKCSIVTKDGVEDVVRYEGKKGDDVVVDVKFLKK